MPREFFRRSTGGFRSPNGEIVRKLQTALNLQPGAITIKADGDFGGETEKAVKRFQAARGEAQTGVIDDQNWATLMGNPGPGIFERCLQLTADFEGTGFGIACGNFDGAGVTWGIIGYTLSNDELSKVLRQIDGADPSFIDKSFGANAVTLRHMCAPTTSNAERMAWANAITNPSKRDRTVEPWNTSFFQLGQIPKVQELQTKKAFDDYWTPMLGDAAALGMSDELDFALLYDIRVQNGGVAGDKRAAALGAIAAQKPATPEAKRLVVAEVIAQASSPEWQNDVRARKAGISRGTPTVHMSNYRIADWGLVAGIKAV